MNGRTLERFLPDEAATARFGEDIAAALRAGDVLALNGDLGMGKSSLARAVIRALADDAGLEVPSPTFTLVQAYEARIPVRHFDLYRLSSPEELEELGFEEAIEAGVVLVEWPDRAGDRLPADAIWIELAEAGDGRVARLRGPEEKLARLERSLAARDFLNESGWHEAVRTPQSGDASARSYETIEQPGRTPAILMNSPPLLLGPPVRGGKAYAEIAHTARSVTAFAAIDRLLEAAGFAVPVIHTQDLDSGFLIIENLGSENLHLPDGEPIPERYVAAAELLAEIHRRDWPGEAEAAPGVVHAIPPFDRPAMLIEVDLLLDWYLPAVAGRQATAGERDGFAKAWNAVLDRISGAERSLMLRDIQSPNFLWRGRKRGLARLGLIDFQDALIGPAAYDVASLAMDARVTIPPTLENEIVDAYCSTRARQGGFDRPAFEEAYAIMAAQRNSKILGIFVRLNKRDGKPQYLRHLPRIRDYVARAVSHPSLASLRDFYEKTGILGDAP
ncbi:tRNA (adenosine(37)-N6)-threonylcarbamoyltransferase complex ATPase subunit type 1 TsaE [Aquamicrobium sp. LC103]|uniref:tRNA (adenosine(37)-N6)-threonylcarbamoyltransferase complex ATPase subunit type 1 TsaE n=1 Tax=Aquamicrobium sp. LC103 TaxID=1120658 RepID=UPI00063E8B02|nr:tRNA (adenosine(37)-N6)-threonylcarbamoyltransferase complex ATPase subunit type 1 TsaE [Aquamicrobium sp. LC103]TKT82772.1 tRNA (adenosine(37)-N6)-threonylcarbamoyltransferase complex ATPase subunit type 1 TsaE [Aquamicrobium sp. LC103]